MTQFNRSKTGLVLQGGGARGAYQVGALRAISDILNTQNNPFAIISGTSVGAINTSSLASNAGNFITATRRLENLWAGLTSHSIFDARTSAIATTAWHIIAAFRFAAKTNRYGLLDNRPLRRLLENEFSRDGINAAFKSGALEALCITTSCYTSGTAITYFETSNESEAWSRARREGRRTEINVDHLMASSALPFIFPAVKIDSTYQGDGSLRLSTPLSPVIRMGADRAVIIGVRDAEVHSTMPTGEPAYPSMGEMAGHALDILFNDNLDADIEQVKRVNTMLDHISVENAKALNLKKFELLTLLPSQDLRTIARKHEGEMPRAIRFVLKAMGAWHTDGRMPSYLLFEPGYIQALISLGYDDTMARADELRAFFQD